MLSFCSQDRALIDANGRIKLSPRTIIDFNENGGLDVVLHCLPEGAIAVYPERTYLAMRKEEPKKTEKASSSLVLRRIMRRFGALSRSEKITAQGRITIPSPYREYANIGPGGNAIIVGCEIGIEIWNAENWSRELEKINAHFNEKGENEMLADLASEHSDCNSN